MYGQWTLHRCLLCGVLQCTVVLHYSIIQMLYTSLLCAVLCRYTPFCAVLGLPAARQGRRHRRGAEGHCLAQSGRRRQSRGPPVTLGFQRGGGAIIRNAPIAPIVAHYGYGGSVTDAASWRQTRRGRACPLVRLAAEGYPARCLSGLNGWMRSRKR